MDLFKLLGRIVIENDEANKKLRETSGEAKETSSKFSSAMGKVGSAAVKVGKVAATGIAAAGAAIGGVVVSALNASGELEQNVGGAESVFKSLGSSIDKMSMKIITGYDKATGKAIKTTTTLEKVSKNAYKNMGLSTSDFLATANKMGSLFQGAGFETQEALDLSASAMQRAADVASIMGIDTSAAMESIAGAAKGNFTMMDNLGVAMNDTTLQAYALSKGITKSTKDMTNQEKIGLAMEMFMEKTAYAAGNYAKENETLAGSLGTAKSALTNFLDGSGGVEELVNSFSNLANVAVNSLNKILPRLIGALPALVQGILPQIPALLQTILPSLTEGAIALLTGLAQILPEIAMVLVEQIPIIIGQIRTALETEFPQLEEPFAVMEGLFTGIWQALQTAWDLIGKPVWDAVSSAVSAAKDALQPLIDAFSEYVISGGFAEDATNAVKVAADALKTAYESVVGFVNSVVTGFQDAVEWGKEHETALILIATAVGTLTAAIGAYNVAMAIKKAGGIVEIAQLAATAIGVGALTVAETAHTVATTVATVATTAFGAAMAFLTSPITLVVLAIGALIAIIVVCVKHWDDIKLAASKAWEWIKETWNKVASWFNEKVIQPILNFFGNLWDGIKNTWNGIKTSISNVVTGIKDKVSSVFNSIKEKMSEPIQKARDTIKGIVDKIKGFFSGMKISFPNIKLPHFSIKPKGWQIADLFQGSIPSLGIDWYAKAMKEPMVMTEPTIFGYNPRTGNVMGGGEAGSEVVSGTNTLLDMISEVVAAQNGNLAYYLQKLIEILASYFPQILDSMERDVVLDTGATVGALVVPMNRALGKLSDRKDRGR